MRFSAKFFFLLLFFGGAWATSPPNAQTVASPLPPRADRFGIYNWGVDYAAYPGGTLDRLNWAADKVATLGSRTIRVALPGNSYLLAPPRTNDLAQIAASAAYETLFTDARFQTYLLTAYSANDMQNQWSDGFSATEAQATRDEFARLAQYLLTQPRFAGKTFIILNWEGDNAMESVANKQSIWDAYTAWIQARADGIKTARQRFPDSAVRLYSGLEFNLVRTRHGVPCGQPTTDRLQRDPLKNRCVIDYVAPRVNVDFYSYSSWQTVLETALQNGNLKNALRTDLTFALNHIRTQKPAVQERQFLLGEYGFLRSYWGENAVANWVSEMFDALEAPDAFPVSYAIFWQIIDNTPSHLGGDDGFGLYRSRHGQFNLTRAGTVFQKRMAGQTVTPFVPRPLIRIDAPEIRREHDTAPVIAALLNSKRNFLLDIGATFSLFVSPPKAIQSETEKQVLIDALNPSAMFSPRDNAVRVEQGLRQLSLPRDFGVTFLESELQIKVGLPPTLHHGNAMLYVTDRDGVESNAQHLRLMCGSCPVITGVIDDKEVGELHSGGIVTLKGSRFSAANNTVTIEQLDAEGAPQRFVVTPDNGWSESPERIRLRLPAALLPQKLAVVTVTTQESLTSNQFVIWLTRDCISCAPVLHLPQAITNYATNNSHFYPGALVTIRGERFSANENRVVFEQGTRQFAITAGRGWSETPTQIRVELPQELSPGYALFYVVDAQGRESRAQSFLLTHAPGRRVVRGR
jgi:hypothetical protein